MTEPKARTPLAIGEWISHRVGHALITLTRTHMTYVVDTYAGPTRLDDWCRAYSTEAEAREAARHTARAFHTHGTDAAISRRVSDLTAIVDEQIRRDRHRMADRKALAAAEAELDALATLADLAMRRQLLADLAGASVA
jgi:hypothetical protein